MDLKMNAILDAVGFDAVCEWMWINKQRTMEFLESMLSEDMLEALSDEEMIEYLEKKGHVFESKEIDDSIVELQREARKEMASIYEGEENETI